jgi:putative oxidoreductase
MMDSLRFVPALGRLLIAVLFVPAGFQKLTGFDGSVAYVVQHGLPLPSVAIVLAILIELGCGILVLIGYQTRWAAAAMAIFSVAAAIFFHNDFNDMDMRIHFMKNIAIAGGLLQLVYFGAGPISIDNRNR